MKKIWGWILGVVIVAAVVIYIIWNNSNNGSNAAASANAPSTTPSNTTATGSGTGTAASGSEAGVAVGAGVGAGAGMTTGSGAYTDGGYTGSVANAVYGQLQIAVTIKGGKITDVTWPVYPDSAGHTQQVNDAALPQLEQEAITSQSANVSIISGATQTSQAFQQSLASALLQSQS